MQRALTVTVTAMLVLAVPTAASAHSRHTIRVAPGGSIQAAVDQAAPGDRIVVAPGTYTEAGHPCPTNPADVCAVVITKDGITLQGSAHGRVVLQSADGQSNGITVARTGDPACLDDASLRVRGSTISGITVRGFDENGVLLYCVDNWRITHSVADDNDEYGFFPSHVGSGRIDHSAASGANDTGIYVGQSHDVRMDHNVATDNVSGFEIENSVRVRADHNLSHGNTAGILSFALPFLDVTENDRNRIDHNAVFGNNRANTCEPGDEVCFVPTGTGIALAGADHNLVEHNLVLGNDSFGIAVANVCNALQIPSGVCAVLDIEPNSDGNRVLHNRVLGNGGHPDPSLALPGADLVWDGTGVGNCWSHDVAGTRFPDPLPSC